MSHKSLSQQEVIALLKNRDEEGFNYLYDHYSAALYGIIFRILSLPEESNEALQDTFLKIWNSIDQYDENKGSLYTWMLNIARNTAIDRLKSKSFRNGQKNQTISDFVNYSEGLSTEQQHHFHEMENLLKELKEDHRIILDKAYFGGLTQEEISKDLGIPLGTVKTRARAALMELRQILKKFKDRF